MMATDLNIKFIEHCLINKHKYPIENCNMNFLEHDFLGDVIVPGGLSGGNHYDIATFGFEVSLDLLRKKQKSFKIDAHLIVPVSREDFDLEQDFKVLQYKGNDQFDVVEEVMRTSFA